MKTSQKKLEKKQVSINIPIDLLLVIKEAANKENRSLSGQIIFLLSGGEPPRIKPDFLPEVVNHQ